MGLFKNKEQKRREKEFKDFQDDIGVVTPKNEKENNKKIINDVEQKNILIQKMKSTFNRLLNEDKIKQSDMDKLEGIIDKIRYQKGTDDPMCTKFIDSSIMKALSHLEKTSDEYGKIATAKYIERLRTLVSQRESPDPKYRNIRYLKMEHNTFTISASLDSAKTDIDHLKSVGAEYKQDYLKAKEKGDKVSMDRIMEEMARTKDSIESRQLEIDGLLKKEKLAKEMSAVLAETANSESFQFEDEDFDMLNEICGAEVYDDKKVNQGLEIIEKYKNKKKAQNTKVSVNDNDFESKTERTVSKEEEDELLNMF